MYRDRQMGLFRRSTDPAEIERIKAELAELRAALEQAGAATPPPDPRVDELAGEIAALDARVTSVSTELANQLTELGHDIDALNARPAGDGADPAAVSELRDGQVRLANEQARYQIAFREDLARLASDLRRASLRLNRPRGRRDHQLEGLVDERLRLVDLRLVLAEVRRECGVGLGEQVVGLRAAARPVVTGPRLSGGAVLPPARRTAVGADAIAEIGLEAGEQLAERLAERLPDAARGRRTR